MRTSSGFTMIELMVTIAVAAILTAMAYPSFDSMIRSNRVAAGTNGLIASFNLARTEAIRSNRGAGVCPSATGADAGTKCDGGDWNTGLLVFADNDSNGVWSAGDVALRHVGANPSLSFTASPDDGSSTVIKQVAFDSRGRVSSGVDLFLKPSDCKTGSNLQRRIRVSRIGQTRLSKEPCA